MKKLLSILTLTTLTAAGATVLYFGTSISGQPNSDPKTLIASSQTIIPEEQQLTTVQTDTIKQQTKSTEISDCFTYECAYLQYSDMLEGRKPVDFKRAVFIL
ncbi:MAG: hypothetical protein ACOVOQ_01980 [Flavobacterium sp.]